MYVMKYVPKNYVNKLQRGSWREKRWSMVYKLFQGCSRRFISLTKDDTYLLLMLLIQLVWRGYSKTWWSCQTYNLDSQLEFTQPIIIALLVLQNIEVRKELYVDFISPYNYIDFYPKRKE